MLCRSGGYRHYFRKFTPGSVADDLRDTLSGVGGLILLKKLTGWKLWLCLGQEDAVGCETVLGALSLVESCRCRQKRKDARRMLGNKEEIQ